MTNYCDTHNAMFNFHSYKQVYVHLLQRYELMQQIDYAQTVDIQRFNNLKLVCLDLVKLNANDIQHGYLYDYESAFNYLFNYNKRRLNDGVIINAINGRFKKINIARFSFAEAKQIIEHNLVLINKFNEYYKNVQLIQQIEDM